MGTTKINRTSPTIYNLWFCSSGNNRFFNGFCCRIKFTHPGVLHSSYLAIIHAVRNSLLNSHYFFSFPHAQRATRIYLSGTCVHYQSADQKVMDPIQFESSGCEFFLRFQQTMLSNHQCRGFTYRKKGEF